MKASKLRPILAFLAVAALALLAFFPSSQALAEPEGKGPAKSQAKPPAIPYQPESLVSLAYEEALADSAVSGKKVMVYFWADWCVNCEAFNRDVLPDSRVAAALAKGFNFVPVDTERDVSGLGKEYRVRVVPTFVFLEKDGQPATMLPGALPAELFAHVLDYVSSDSYLTMEFEEFMEKRKS
jgi:thioredoxin-related protein